MLPRPLHLAVALAVTLGATVGLQSRADAADFGGRHHVVQLPSRIAPGHMSLDVVTLKGLLGTLQGNPALAGQARADLTVGALRTQAMTFDPATRDAVRRFQQAERLTVTGEVQPQDWNRLYERMAQREASLDNTQGDGPRPQVTRNANGSHTLSLACPYDATRRSVVLLTDYSQRGRITRFGTDEFDSMAQCTPAQRVAMTLSPNPHRVPGVHHYGMVVRTTTLNSQMVVDTHVTFLPLTWAAVNPAVPTALSAQLGPSLGQATLTWSHTPTPDFPATYTVDVTTNNASAPKPRHADGRALPTTMKSGEAITGLTPGVEYRFTVTATVGFGSTTAQSPAFSPAVAVPTDLSAQLGTTPGDAALGATLGNATLTWNHSSPAGFPATYTVDVTTDTTAPKPRHADGRPLPTAMTAGEVITGLTPGVEYRFTVTATIGSRSATAQSSFTTPVTVPRSAGACSVPSGTFAYRPTGSPYHQLDVLPRQAGTAARGTIVFVHGGGFAHETPMARRGNFGSCPHAVSLEMGAIEAQRARGWDVVTISYRPSVFRGQHISGNAFPEPLLDVGAAIDWVRGSEARSIGVNADKVVVAGHSAGGTLAALAGAYSERVVPGTSQRFPRIDGWIALGAPLDATEPRAFMNISSLVHGNGSFVSSADPKTQLAIRGAATPPGYLIHGTDDPIIPITNAVSIDALTGPFELDPVDATRNKKDESNHRDHFAIGGADARRLNAWFDQR